MDLLRLAEEGRLPTALVRHGIRRELRRRLRRENPGSLEAEAERVEAFVTRLGEAPLRVDADLANAQHYEVPAAFFAQALGRHRKYSSCFWRPDTASLDEAEAAALAISCARADIANGQSILDLGCGWGSLSLWIAERYPDCRITAVSNSDSQREHIVAEARTQLGELESI